MNKYLCLLLAGFCFISCVEEKPRDRANRLKQNIITLQNERNFTAAIDSARVALGVLQGLQADNLEISGMLCHLGTMCYSIGSLNEAEAYFNQARGLLEQMQRFDEANQLLATVLDGLALIYESMRDVVRADDLHQQARTVREEQLGFDHPEAKAGRESLAKSFRERGEPDKALRLREEELARHEQALGKDHPIVADDLQNLADILIAMGSYDQAESYLKRALRILEKKFGAYHSTLAKLYNDLALLYQRKGEFPDADTLFTRLRTIRERDFGNDHPVVATVQHNLAVLYEKMGDYHRADSLYRRAQRIKEEKLNRVHPEVYAILSDFSKFCDKIASYPKAESLYLQMLTIRQQELRPKHKELISILNDLAALYIKMGLLPEAEKRYLEARGIYELERQSNYEDMVTTSNHLAALYNVMGNHSEAKKIYKQVLDSLKKNLGPDHLEVANAFANLSRTYSLLRAPGDATRLEREAQAIRKRSLPPTRPNFVLGPPPTTSRPTRTRLIQILDSLVTERRREADLRFHFYRRLFPHLSEEQQLIYIQENPLLPDLWPWLCFEYGSQLPSLRGLIAYMSLNSKGLMLEALTHQAKESNIVNQIAQLQTGLSKMQGDYTSLYQSDPLQSGSPERYTKRIDELEKQQKKVEEELLGLAELESSFKDSPVSTDQIRQTLSVNEVFVDFLYFRDLENIGQARGTGKTRFLAIVFQANRQDTVINIEDAEPIENGIIALKANIKTALQTGSRSSETLAQKEGRQLWERVFRPIQKIIGDKKEVIICPDGPLHYLPFGIMVNDQSRYLAETYTLRYVTSGRELIPSNKAMSGKSNQSVIIANPNFEFDLSKSSSTESQSQEPVLNKNLRKRLALSFSALKHASTEALAIDSLFVQKSVPVQQYQQDQAREVVLRNIISPQILHIITHGAFLDYQPISTELISDQPALISMLENPMLHSYLAFAGAKHASVITRGENGIATALEIARLNLLGTDMVTLSACETGLGEIKDSEGVYGLHRSFLLAGAKTVLASLWSVRDLETKDLMVEFYRRYLFGENISKSEALRQAQLAVIEQLRKKYGAAHPAYWGAFVCIGEP